MKKTLLASLIIALVAIASLAQSDEAPVDEAPDGAALPPAASEKVDFHQDVLPILAQRCAHCHTGENDSGGLLFDSRETLMAGGDSGAAVVVGKSGESLLVQLVAGADADRIMPAKGKRLSAKQVGVLRAWIDQGAEWEEGVSLRKVAEAEWNLRRPEIPAMGENAAPVNLIDRVLAPYYAANKFSPPAPVDDATYARRVYLDITGLLPSVEQLDEFIADPSADKRRELVRRVLADRRNYAIHWLSFWNDALRNDYKGTGYIDGGRKPITDWLVASLMENKPYDRFVSELVAGAPGAEGFVKGIVWRGVVNASQLPPMQAAQNVSQVFLGVNLKCASCHDSFINNWTLADSYALANVFADQPLEIHRCNEPTGKFSDVRFLRPEMGAIDAAAKREERMARLAEILTSRQDGRFARTIVNRLWAKFFGRGMIEPVDEMDNPAWNADLLDALACDLVDHDYNLDRTIELMLASAAYQLPSTGMAEQTSDDFAFRGPVVRRLSAEQFVDALMTLTGAWYEKSYLSLPKPSDQQAARIGVRAAEVPADALLVALGRPNREQVVTSRTSTATTLEALELTNGATLAKMLAQGAERYMTAEKQSTEAIVSRIYREACGREPTAEEVRDGAELIGSPATKEGVEDLLWLVTMLPEFQLIQ